MTGEEFKAALADLGWKQADLCRKLDITKNTASAWATKAPPGWAAEYLRVMLDLDRLHRVFVRPPRPERATPPAAVVQTGRAARMVRQLADKGLPESTTD